MKKFLITLIICLTSIIGYATSNHTYFDVSNNGTLNVTEYTTTDFSIKIDSIIYNKNYVSIALTFTGKAAIYEVYRLHGDGTHRTNDTNDPLWNMELQPKSDLLTAQYCYYEYENGIIKFRDTFDTNILKNTQYNGNPDANTIRYRIYDKTNNNDYTIQFNNAFAPIQHGIVTSIEQLTNSSQSIYYDLSGHSSNKPFNGINIVKRGNVITKEIYR